MTVLAIAIVPRLLSSLLYVAGLVLLASGTTAAASFLYRVRVRHQLPEGASLILGLGVVALTLNTRSLLVGFVQEGALAPTIGEATINVIVFLGAAVASYGGRSIGDRFAQSDRLTWGTLAGDFSPIVRAAGRHIAVTLPEEIDDIEGYEPVDPETKAALAERTLDFPRGLTVAELEAQLLARLKEKYDVGYVDVELTEDGRVTYLGVATRPAGIGPTLPPNAAAVAIRADPPFSATAGDVIQLWEIGETGPSQLGTAELRARVGQVATVITDRDVARAIDPETSYRLLTLAADSHPDREFAAMLRRAEETMRALTVGSDSPLVGISVAALAVTVLGIRKPGAEIETVPNRSRTIGAGDELFVIGRPETFRKLEAFGDVETVGDSGSKAAENVTRRWKRPTN
ncbi:MAG: TrkA C-terminal domain-containing protein [Halodesulfurarchaeum sp.]